MFQGIVAVTDMALRTFWRDKHALFWGIAFPVMLMGLIGTVFSSTDDLALRVSVVSDGLHPLSEGIIAALENIPALQVVREEEEAALAALRRGDRSLVVVLPSGAVDPGGQAVATSDPATVRVFFDESRMQVAHAGIAMVSSVVDEFNRQLTGRPDVLAVESVGVSVHHLSMFDFLLPGILAMGLMQSGLMGVSAVVTGYRERRLLKRVLATPFPPAAFIAGIVARFTLTNLMQGLIILLIGVLVFKARVVGGYVELLVLAIFGSVVFLTIGFAISTVSKTPEAANTLGSAVAFPMMFLSGTFWPREFIPPGLQPLIEILPLTPLVDAMRGVATQGDSIAAHAGGLLYLLLWALAALFVAVRRFRWE
ncbi:MAG: ABC transporter permease [Firmicutes bacterium]|nr:ABC transporter permease [Bacillota bacterium]